MQTSAYCSWCYQTTIHTLHEKRRVGRDTYICQSCGCYTVPCRYCQHMAQGGLNPKQLEPLEGRYRMLFKGWHNELCAEHDGTIASFKRLETRIPDLHRYDDLFRRDAVNIAKAGRYGMHIATWSSLALLTVGSGGTAGPAAVAAGRAGLMGATGMGAMLATKAAVQSGVSLAMIGSAAGGIPILAATALGSAYGGAIANQYHADDPSFAVKLLSEHQGGGRTLFVNGFLQQEDSEFADWSSEQRVVDPEHRLYGVTWSSKTLKDIGAVVGLSGDPLRKGLTRLVLGRLPGHPLLGLLAKVAGNPWHVAMSRAGQTGVLLAEILAREEGPPVTLVGHSLGCRVIYYALEALGRMGRKRVADAILLGGAVGRADTQGWGFARSAVNGRIFNCYSKKDSVLSLLYKNANGRVSDPIGAGPITLEDEKVQNFDCTDLVSGHLKWKENYGAIVQRIRGQIGAVEVMGSQGRPMPA